MVETKYNLITLNGISDSISGWSLRIGHTRTYLDKIRARYGYEEMIERLKSLTSNGDERFRLR